MRIRARSVEVGMPTTWKLLANREELTVKEVRTAV
jgi:hypothetical protein